MPTADQFYLVLMVQMLVKIVNHLKIVEAMTAELIRGVVIPQMAGLPAVAAPHLVYPEIAAERIAN